MLLRFFWNLCMKSYRKKTQEKVKQQCTVVADTWQVRKTLTVLVPFTRPAFL